MLIGFASFERDMWFYCQVLLESCLFYGMHFRYVFTKAIEGSSGTARNEEEGAAVLQKLNFFVYVLFFILPGENGKNFVILATTEYGAMLIRLSRYKM